MTDTEILAKNFEALHDKYLAERDKRLCSDGTAQYVAMDSPFIGDIDDSFAGTRIERAPFIGAPASWSSVMVSPACSPLPACSRRA